MSRTIAQDISRSTTLCMSLSARPGNTGTRFHNYLYDALGLDYVYKAFTTTDIAAAIGGVRALGIRGCAISMPWKEDVIALVDELDESARVIESVNTIVNTDGHLAAYNTDYLAIVQLLDLHRVDPSTPFAVLGSGGMAKATVAGLRDSGFADGTVVARNESTGAYLADKYGYRWQAAMEDLRPGLVINCTPVGMADGPDVDAMPTSHEVLESSEVVFDVVMRPQTTVLLAEAERAGKRVITGSEVATIQALEQFVLYTGVRPEDDLVERAAAFSRQG